MLENMKERVLKANLALKNENAYYGQKEKNNDNRQ